MSYHLNAVCIFYEIPCITTGGPGGARHAITLLCKINTTDCPLYGWHRAETWLPTLGYKQRFLTPGHQGWNDLHRLCRIGMEYYLPNNDNNINNINNDNNNNNNNNNKTMMMMMMIIIRMMTMVIIGTTTIMIMIIIITTTLTMTIMKMIMIKTAQTPCQSLYKDRRIQNKIAWYNWYYRDDVMLILHEMLHTCSIMHTQWRCKFENTKHRCLGMFLHKCNLHCSGRN